MICYVSGYNVFCQVVCCIGSGVVYFGWIFIREGIVFVRSCVVVGVYDDFMIGQICVFIRVVDDEFVGWVYVLFGFSSELVFRQDFFDIWCDDGVNVFVVQCFIKVLCGENYRRYVYRFVIVINYREL